MLNRTRGEHGVRIVVILTTGLLLVILASSQVSQAQQQVNIEMATNPTPPVSDRETSFTFNAKDAAGYLIKDIDYLIKLVENTDPDYPSVYLEKKVHSNTGSHVEKLTLPSGKYEANVQIVGINFQPVTPITNSFKFDITRSAGAQPPPAPVAQPAPPPQQVPQPALSISVEVAPTSATSGQKLTFTWEVKGLGKIAHTAVHWDTKPGNPADFKSYAKATPDFASLNPAQDAPKKYTVTVDAPTSGIIYYVVHAIVDGKNVYAPDGERKIPISAPPAPQQVTQPAPSISIGTVPTSATPGEKLTFAWEVKGSGKIAHTAVHWDTKPGNPNDFKSYPKATPDFASLNPAQDAPKKYTVTVDAPASGTIYYVVHAIVDGKNIYAADGEKTITITAPPAPQQPAPAPAPQPAYREPQTLSKPESTSTDFVLIAGGVAAVIVVGVGFAVYRARKH